METMSVAQLARFAQQSILSRKRILGYCVDSRDLKQGQVFFALPGERVDGHEYLAKAASNGAVAAVVSRFYQGSDYGLPLIRVSDVLKTLQDLARHKLAKHNPRIVAITGSVGKTTTKEFTISLLKQKYKVGGTPSNSNSQIGMPLAILNHIKGDEDILVMEMGMSQPGNIANLVNIAPPDIAVITTTALVHACNFDSLAAIGQAKAEIFSHPKTQLGLLHRDIINFSELSHMGQCQKLSFSTNNSQADYYLEDAENKMKMRTFDGERIFNALTLPGKHNQHNFLAAVGVARYFNLSWEEIEKGMTELTLPALRLEIVEKRGVTFVNDSYNACSISIKMALQSLPKPGPKGKKIAVIGEMVELGKFSKECHQDVGEASLEHVDKIFCLGKECEPIVNLWNASGRQVEWIPNRAELPALITALRQEISPGDVVLLKGSRANGLWKVLEEI